MKKMSSHEEAFRKLCDDISDDIDAELCDEVKEHLEECPECRVYVDTLRKTVYLYREEEKQQEAAGIPDDVSRRLFKVLDLEDMRSEIEEERQQAD